MLRGLANAEMGMMRKKSKRSDVVRVCGKSNMEKKKDKGRKKHCSLGNLQRSPRTDAVDSLRWKGKRNRKFREGKRKLGTKRKMIKIDDMCLKNETQYQGESCL
jgi:hypothetical protein